MAELEERVKILEKENNSLKVKNDKLVVKNGNLEEEIQATLSLVDEMTTYLASTDTLLTCILVQAGGKLEISKQTAEVAGRLGKDYDLNNEPTTDGLVLYLQKKEAE